MKVTVETEYGDAEVTETTFDGAIFTARCDRVKGGYNPLSGYGDSIEEAIRDLRRRISEERLERTGGS